uniref:CMP/dCMP-type deaminase domain-containing protein n=1 Tax=Meloidogyne incognita TaxID=6306 RepID=A0A914M4Y2_MELIC
METSDLLFINESFSLAQKAYDLQEVPVGCVFVFDGLIIGRGHNEVNKTKNPTRHAEFVAIDQASDWCCENGKEFQEVMKQSTVYVSLEPCIMCSSALYQLKIKRLLFGAKNFRFGGILSVASNKDYGHEHEIELIPEVCAEKSISLLKKFYDRENPFAPLDKRKVKMEM